MFLLTQYFLENPEHLDREGLFRVNGEKQSINKLATHLQLGHFAILNDYKSSPNEVANFLKEILRELTDPVCTFAKYECFRDIPKSYTPEQKLSEVVFLLRNLPELNRSTLIFLARFFMRLSQNESKNKMSMYNLAVIITPNLFRCAELSSKDLMNHGTLTDVFLMLMTHVDHIIEEIKKPERNLVNDILLFDQPPPDSAPVKNRNRTNNR